MHAKHAAQELFYIYRERQDSMFERKRKLCSEKNSLKTFTTIKINLSSQKVKGKKNKKNIKALPSKNSKLSSS